MLNPKHAGRALGALAFDALSLARGERITKRPVAQPHHRKCDACGFDRWDGVSDHRWGGGRFAQRVCYGPPPSGVQKPPTTTNALVDELHAFATGEGEVRAPESETETPPRQDHRFEVLGDARRRS